MATIKPKGKQVLDSMSKTEIEDFRVKYLSQSIVPDQEARRYFKELDLYITIRFKDDVFARYERWIQEVKNPNSLDQQYLEATKFIVEIIEKMGKEYFYKSMLDQTIRELGEMEYVK